MKASASSTSRRGFALIATLSIMVLLALLTVGLLSLSTTALRSSAQSKDRAIAQANARLALMIAIGEIQTSLGPDQRVTARSEMLGANPANPLLTGVFKTSRANPPADPAGYFEKLRQESKGDAVWLASSVNPITNPSTQSAAQLSERTARLQSAFDESGKEIFVQAGKIPLVNGDDQITGSYAWWADDESQKAKLNIVAPDALPNGDPFEDQWKLVPAQQANFFRVDQDPSAAAYSAGEILNYDPDDRKGISKLVSLHQADIPYEVAGSRDWFRRNQTDITTRSIGLPVDVLQGRLKQDLSAYLETGNGLSDDEPVIRGSSADTGYTGPALAGLDYTAADMPRFGRIKSWKEIGETVTDFDTGGTESIARTETEHGIHPVILRAGIYYAPYLNSAVRPQTIEAPDGSTKPGFFVSWKLAAYPRITIWNPTSVPITDPWYLYQVGVTNHFMLVLSGEQGDARSGGAARDDSNVEYWRTFSASDNRRMSFYNMMNANRQSYVIPSGGSGEATMPLHTYALRMESPLLPGQTRTFYPESSTPPLLKFVGEVGRSRFLSITNAQAGSGNIMSATPAPNNYFRVTSGNGNEFENRIYAKGPGNGPATTRPSPPEFLESFLYVRMAESGPGFKGGRTHGCAYRLFKPNDSGQPTLLQEIFSAEHTNATRGYPTYSISNAMNYDDPDDGAAAFGFTSVKFYEDPNQEVSSRRGHQVYISYGLEDPESDFSSVFKDESTQFSSFTHYNPRSTHVFPGTFEENTTGVGDGVSGFDSSIQGIRQELYSEGRPESAWLNDWSVDSIGSSESDYGPNNDFGSPGLYDLNLGSNGLVYPLFDFPRANDGVRSLGDLQAVDFTTYPWQPGNAFGNSYADPRVPRDQIANDVDQDEDHPYIRSLELGTNRYVDLSWLLNYSLWDRFFLSTIDYASGSPEPVAGDALRNSRNQLTFREGQKAGDPVVDFDGAPIDEAAANIRIDGPFNVNTTSVAAWKQFLSSNFNRRVPVKNIDSGNESSPPDQASFPRMLYPYRAELPDGSREVGSSDEATRSVFGGNRSLTDEEVQKLAEKIVEEVKLRGPFLSISDFVNRRLVGDSDDKYGEWAGLSGVLQTAIDRVTVEDDMINDHLEADSDLLFSSDDVPDYLQQAHVTGRPRGLEQSRLAGTPGSLSQADILRTIGPMLTARGDTFRIRAYGESRDASGRTNAEAWCEAVLQRVADTLDPDDDLIKPDQAAHPFGRKFNIVGFRWLNENEI